MHCRTSTPRPIRGKRSAQSISDGRCDPVPMPRLWHHPPRPAGRGRVRRAVPEVRPDHRGSRSRPWIGSEAGGNAPGATGTGKEHPGVRQSRPGQRSLQSLLRPSPDAGLHSAPCRSSKRSSIAGTLAAPRTFSPSKSSSRTCCGGTRFNPGVPVGSGSNGDFIHSSKFKLPCPASGPGSRSRTRFNGCKRAGTASSFGKRAGSSPGFYPEPCHGRCCSPCHFARASRSGTLAVATVNGRTASRTPRGSCSGPGTISDLIPSPCFRSRLNSRAGSSSRACPRGTARFGAPAASIPCSCFDSCSRAGTSSWKYSLA